jgi:hypothetical protein
MSPSESPQTINATPALIRLLDSHAIGTLCASLLSSRVREEFEALLFATSDKEPVLSRAGLLLIGRRSDQEFIADVAKRLAADLEGAFWVEVIEQVIRNTSCKFDGLGEFKRFELKVSFSFDLLPDQARIRSISGEYTPDVGLDALCRVVMEPLRAQAKTRYRGALSLNLRVLTSDFLTSALGSIFPVLNLPAKDASQILAAVSALTSYYAWVVAFETLMLLSIPVSVRGIGSFTFVGGATNRVDFNSAREFDDLIKSNVQSDLPDEQVEPEAAA